MVKKELETKIDGIYIWNLFITVIVICLIIGTAIHTKRIVKIEDSIEEKSFEKESQELIYYYSYNDQKDICQPGRIISNSEEEMYIFTGYLIPYGCNFTLLKNIGMGVY